MTNTLGFILTLVYIITIIVAGEGLRRWRGYSSDFTRKVVHIGVGMVMWLLPVLFTNPGPFIAASASFVVINFLDWKYGFFAAISSTDRSNLGTVYFPIATAVAAYIFWDSPPLMIAAIMPLTWGDGLAPVFGRKFGMREYTILGQTRTLEGSVAFFTAAIIATTIALALPAGTPEFTVSSAILPAVLVSTITALVEGITPLGLDNLTITAAAILVLSLI